MTRGYQRGMVIVSRRCRQRKSEGFLEERWESECRVKRRCHISGTACLFDLVAQFVTAMPLD